MSSWPTYASIFLSYKQSNLYYRAYMPSQDRLTSHANETRHAPSTQLNFSEVQRFPRSDILKTISSAEVSQITHWQIISHTESTLFSAGSSGKTSWSTGGFKRPLWHLVEKILNQTAADMETGCLNSNSVRYVNRGNWWCLTNVMQEMTKHLMLIILQYSWGQWGGGDVLCGH